MPTRLSVIERASAIEDYTKDLQTVQHKESEVRWFKHKRHSCLAGFPTRLRLLRSLVHGISRYVSTTLHQPLTPLRITTCQAHLTPDRIKVLTVSIQSGQKRLSSQLAKARSYSRRCSPLIEIEMN